MNVREQMLHSYKSVYYLVILCFVFSYFFIVHSLMVCVIPSCVCYLFRSLQGNQACKMFSLYKIKEKKKSENDKKEYCNILHTDTDTNTHTKDAMVYDLERMRWRYTQSYSSGLVPRRSLVGLLRTEAKSKKE